MTGWRGVKKDRFGSWRFLNKMFIFYQHSNQRRIGGQTKHHEATMNGQYKGVKNIMSARYEIQSNRHTCECIYVDFLLSEGRILTVLLV